MGIVTLDPETRSALNRELVDFLKREGLMCVTQDIALLGIEAMQTRKNVMKRKYVSPNTIEKHHLLAGVKTRHTVVNMIKDGRITVDEWFKDVSGNYQVLTKAIRRLNNE